MTSPNRTNRSRISSPYLLFFALIAFSLTSMGCITSAMARHPDTRHTQSRAMNISFDDLHVTSRAGRVTVDYEIDRRDWNRLKRAGINPQIALHVPANSRRGRTYYHYHDSARLLHRRGKVTFYNANLSRRDRTVQLQIDDEHSRRHDRRRGRRVRLERERVEVGVYHERVQQRRSERPRHRRNRSRNRVYFHWQF